MPYELIQLCYEGDFATITMNHPQRRNALSLKHMLELTAAFREVGESSALGVILAANGPAFSARHAQVAERLHHLNEHRSIDSTTRACARARHRHCRWMPAGRNMRPGSCLHRSVLRDPWG